MDGNSSFRIYFCLLCVAVAVLPQNVAFAAEIKVTGGALCEAAFWMAQNGLVMVCIGIVIGAGIIAKEVPLLLGVLLVVPLALLFRLAQIMPGLPLMQDLGCAIAT